MSENYRPTFVKIDRGAIAENTRLLRARLSPAAQLMAVVKADGYGHGALETAKIALANGATSLGVATAEEGVQLREAGLHVPVLILGPAYENGARAACAYDLTQTVQDAQAVRWLQMAARQAGKRARVAVKVDTGMARIGVRDMAAFETLLGAVDQAPEVEPTDVFTHFATADGDARYVRMQQERFAPYVKAVRNAFPKVCLHAANSAALLRFPQTHYDMARAGIALYLRPDLPTGVGEGFRQAMQWVTSAVCVKTVEKGEAVSYGCAFHAERPTRVMTVPVGYADGYHRAIGGRGYALVRGQKAPVIGRVCMDQMMLDVTDIPGAQAWDEVVLLGAQGDRHIDAKTWGSWCGMIDYEVPLSPTGRVPRVYK